MFGNHGFKTGVESFNAAKLHLYLQKTNIFTFFPDFWTKINAFTFSPCSRHASLHLGNKNKSNFIL